MTPLKLSLRKIVGLCVLAVLFAIGLATVSEQYGAALAGGLLAITGALCAPEAGYKLGAAATADRDTPTRTGDLISVPVAAATKIYNGTLVAKDANGRAVPASDTAGLRVIGRAEHTVDNSTGAAGDLSITIRLGAFKFGNSATQPVTQAYLGRLVVAEDDQTVAITTANKVTAGRVLGLDADGVWIDTRYAFYGPKTLPALTSTDGTAAAASANLANLAAEAEKIGDDTRALHGALYG